MTNKKGTKRALLTSVLALVMCVSMLIGTTFAWFTDSISTTNNIITAGNLDVNLYWSTDGNAWAPVDASTNIFKTGTLWEPGHTEVVYLKVKNEGTLALKYDLNVNVASEIEGTNVAGETFKLSDYILYNVYEGVKTYTDSAAARGNETGNKLNTPYNKASQLLNQSDEITLTMVVFMPTTVGNEANYSGNKIPTINLGINLFATQYTKEQDSYGPNYDENAYLCKFVVTSEAELVEALAAAETGDVIGIKGNVTWTTGAGIGSTPFVTNANYITLVGVEEDSTLTAIGSGVGAIGVDKGTVAFKNLKIVDNSASYAENSWEYGYLEFRGNTVFENCEVVNAIMMEGNSATFKNCSFNSNKDSEYAIWVSDGNVTIENCYFTGSRGVKIHEAYGSEVGTVAINNNTFAALSEKPGLAVGTVNADTAITLTNNLFVATQAGDQGLYKYETDTDVTTFNFVDENNTVIADANVIDSAEDLLALSNQKLTGTYVLTADIDLDGASIQSIAAWYGELKILGNGHKISNAKLVAGTHNGMSNYGLFFASTNSTLTISNLVIENATVDATNDTTRNYGAGIVLGYTDGNSNVTLNNVDVRNSHVKNNTVNIGDEAGVYVGYQTGTLTMTDCDSTGCSVVGETAEKTGAFIGMVNGTATLNNCTTDLTIGACNRVGGTLNTNGGWIPKVAEDADSLVDTLEKGNDVLFTNDIQINPANMSNAYGTTGINVKNGQTIDGNGNTLDIKGAGGTWDSGINTTGGLIKNLTVTGSFRGIFINHNSTHSEQVVLENVTIAGTVYTISCDQGMNQTLKATNSTFMGWTSYAATLGSAEFVDCYFGEGSGYAYCRPYAPTTFVGCEFEEGFEIDARAKVTFENCTINGQPLTAENLATLVTSNIANASVVK